MKMKRRIKLLIILSITLLFNSIQMSAQSAVIYKGRHGYDAIFHIDGDVTTIQLFAVLLFYST